MPRRCFISVLCVSLGAGCSADDESQQRTDPRELTQEPTSSGGAASSDDATSGPRETAESPGTAERVERSELCNPPPADSGGGILLGRAPHPDCDGRACGDPCDPCAQQTGCTPAPNTSYACSYDRLICVPIKPE
jgi:hypothetical protein